MLEFYGIIWQFSSMIMIERARIKQKILASLADYPVTLVLGPRQCGKTTLAREIYTMQGGTYFDLEDPECPLDENIAKTVLQNLTGLVVIDEFQRQPSLFQLLRVLADRRPQPARFLILGSASPILVKGASESLAGRVAYVEMGGLVSDETGPELLEPLWRRGGLPRSVLAESEEQSYGWRQNFIQSFLERDIPLLGLRIPAPALRRFWTMLAHFHGQVWNGSELARSLGTGEENTRRYLDILSGSFLVRQLSPWFENTGKRLVKSPKVFLRDSGLLHALLGLKEPMQVLANPRLGFSWEGFALEQVIRLADAERDAYFYKTHAGAELDLLLMRGGKRLGFEFKFADRPVTSKSMHAVIEDLGLYRLFVVYPGSRNFPLSETIEAVPLSLLPEILKRHGLMYSWG